MAGRKLFCSFVDRARRRNIAEGQIAIHRLRVNGNGAEIAGSQRFQFGSERQALSVLIIVEGLFPNTIAREQQRSRSGIPYRESEHPV